MKISIERIRIISRFFSAQYHIVSIGALFVVALVSVVVIAAPHASAQTAKTAQLPIAQKKASTTAPTKPLLKNKTASTTTSTLPTPKSAPLRTTTANPGLPP